VRGTSDIEGKVTRVGASKPGGERVSIKKDAPRRIEAAGASEMHGRAARVAEAISGESRMKKISGNARRNSHCRLFVCFPSFRKLQKLRYSANRSCDLAHRSERTTGKRIVLAVELNGASGTSDMHGNAAKVAGVSREANE
jgi:hypothetical protein